MAGKIAAPVPSIRRLPGYLRYLGQLREDSVSTIASSRIAVDLGLEQTQVRKDLAYTGVVGIPRVGFQVTELIDGIRTYLRWNRLPSAVLAGAGNLGTALLGYRGLVENGLRIEAVFDSAPGKIGTTIHGLQVQPMDELSARVGEIAATIGIVTVPSEAAQAVADRFVACGIDAIWNFAPARLNVPRGVLVEDVELLASLAVLTAHLSTSNGNGA